MLVNAKGTANESGNVVKDYAKDEIISCDKEWQKDLAKVFISENQAIEVKIDEPKEKKAKTKKKVSKKKK